MTTFDEAFERLIGHEGGFTRRSEDRGNWTGGQIGLGALKGTKYGVSAMSYPTLDIENLTLAQAKMIYSRDFWGKAGCDAVPDAVKFDLFDMAVNSGVSAAIKTLQKAAGVLEDGKLGPVTLQAVNSITAPRLIARFNGARLMLITSMAQWAVFGRGLTIRVAQNLLNA